MDATRRRAPDWLWLELSEEQSKATEERTGKDGTIVLLSLEGLVQGRFAPREDAKKSAAQ